MRVVGLDVRFNVRQGQRAIRLVAQGLRLNGTHDSRATGFPTVGVGIFAHQIFIAAATVGQQGAEVALRAAGHEQRRLEPETLCQRGLQRVHGRVVAEDVIANRSGEHGGLHGGGRARDGIAAQVNRAVHITAPAYSAGKWAAAKR